jgi:undecaprenyl-diphosphatase
MTRRSGATDGSGAYLAVGLVVFAAMTLLFAAISEDVVNHEPLSAADTPISRWVHAHGSPGLTTAMRLATSLGSTLTVTGIAVFLSLYLLWRRRPYWLAIVVSSVAGGALLNWLLKIAVQRPRPQFDDPILTFTGYSFPSGHTMMASVLYGVVAAYLCAETPDWGRRVLTLVSASVLIALVGCSRVYLGAHYVSDVLGAMAEGLAWLSLCLTVAYAIWQKKHPIPGDVPE